MKGIIFRSLALWLLVVSVSSATTFKIATLAPDNSSYMTKMRAAAEEITARTEGRAKFKFYTGGVRGSDREVLKLIRARALHGAALTAGGLAAIEKNASIYSMPLTFRDFEEVAYVRARMDDMLAARLEEAGYVSFGFAGAGFSYLMSHIPISTLDDMSRQKIWAPEGDRMSQAAMTALGLSPVPLPLTDVLTGLQTGLIEIIATSPVGAIVLQWHTKVKYVTDLPLVYIYGTLIINKRVFEKLSDADQKVVHEVMGEAYVEIDQNSIVDNKEAMAVLLGKSGLELIQPDADQIPKWRRIVAQSNRRLAEQGEVSIEVMLAVLEHLDEYRNSGAADVKASIH